jgi:hypothetical protein
MTPDKIATYAALQGVSTDEFTARTARHASGFSPAYVAAAAETADLTGGDAAQLVYEATITHPPQPQRAAALAQIAAERHAAQQVTSRLDAAQHAAWAAEALAAKRLADAHAGGAA